MANPRDIARNLRPEINVGDSETPDWTEIKGITEISPSHNRETTDTTGFDSDGQAQHIVTQRSKELSMSGFLVYDTNDDGARDPGQEALMDADSEIGQAAAIDFRLVHRVTDEIMAHYDATVEVGSPYGGGTNDASTFDATITRNGPDGEDVGSTANGGT